MGPIFVVSWLKHSRESYRPVSGPILTSTHSPRLGFRMRLGRKFSYADDNRKGDKSNLLLYVSVLIRARVTMDHGKQSALMAPEVVRSSDVTAIDGNVRRERFFTPRIRAGAVITARGGKRRQTVTRTSAALHVQTMANFFRSRESTDSSL